MDLPYNLTDLTLKTGVDEFRQTLTVLLKNPLGEFHQSNRLGALFDVHQPASDVSMLLRQTIEQLKDVKVENVTVRGEKFHVTVLYKGELVNFEFGLNNY